MRTLRCFMEPALLASLMLLAASVALISLSEPFHGSAAAQTDTYGCPGSNNECTQNGNVCCGSQCVDGVTECCCGGTVVACSD